MARKVEDPTGQRFGRLVVRQRFFDDKRGQARWHCVCDCGGIAVVRTGNLKYRRTVSCGCFKRDVLIRESEKRMLANIDRYIARGQISMEGY